MQFVDILDLFKGTKDMIAAKGNDLKLLTSALSVCNTHEANLPNTQTTRKTNESLYGQVLKFGFK